METTQKTFAVGDEGTWNTDGPFGFIGKAKKARHGEGPFSIFKTIDLSPEGAKSAGHPQCVVIKVRKREQQVSGAMLKKV